MIGQEKLRKTLSDQVASGKLPKFVLLVGTKGSGRKTLAQWLTQQLAAVYPDLISYVLEDVKVDTVRSMVSDVYKSSEYMVCVVPDIDTMAVAAKNVLLKVTEEPPKNVYFVMTLENEGATMDTILSRASVFHMDYYTPEELTDFYFSAGGNDTDIKVLKEICTTPGEIASMMAMEGSVQDFYEYVEKVVRNIDVVSGSNSFKIAEKLAVKGDGGYDLRVFWRAFISSCFQKIEKCPFKYVAGINITTKYLQELQNPSINKQMCFDNWLLDIRQEWFEYAED